MDEDIVKKLQTYVNELHSREVSLIEMKKRDKKYSIKDKILIPLVFTILGAVFGFLFGLI